MMPASFGMCAFGHVIKPGEGCEQCARRRAMTRIKLGYPPYGPLPPLKDSIIEQRRWNSENERREGMAA